MYVYLQVLVWTWQKGVEEIQEEIFCSGAGMSPSFIKYFLFNCKIRTKYGRLSIYEIFSLKMLKTSIGKRAGFILRNINHLRSEIVNIVNTVT